MRIRKKLIVLHTTFSLVLAAILALALRPAVRDVVRDAETHEATTVLSMLLSGSAEGESKSLSEQIERWRERLGDWALVDALDAGAIGLSEDDQSRLRGLARDGLSAQQPLILEGPAQVPVLVAYHEGSGKFVRVSIRLDDARRGVIKLYILATIALLSVYALVAAALEIFVLPQQVYGPIGAMLDADRAVREGREDEQLIPESAIPRDELGEIMRSRNEAILAIRRHEQDLADALNRLEEVASDLKKKNHLLEAARQNLADTGRLASLGMMSAGLAHEMNTPLAVLKGLAEKLGRGGDAGSREIAGPSAATRTSGLTESEAALMRRVVGRLERLSESLLHVARVQPPQTRSTPLRVLIDEAWLLVKMDRRTPRVVFTNGVPEHVVGVCDPDRMLQVFINLLRNAMEACADAPMPPGERATVTVMAEVVERDGGRWASVQIRDNGPGIAAEVMRELFQPFVSTRLDAHGTGLGLAVSEGIVREHGGVIVARNLSPRGSDASVMAGPSARSVSSQASGGAVFEILLPAGEEPKQTAFTALKEGPHS